MQFMSLKAFSIISSTILASKHSPFLNWFYTTNLYISNYASKHTIIGVFEHTFMLLTISFLSYLWNSITFKTIVDIPISHATNFFKACNNLLMWLLIINWLIHNTPQYLVILSNMSNLCFLAALFEINHRNYMKFLILHHMSNI